MQVAIADDFAQRADDISFSFEVHGQVRVRPVADANHAIKNKPSNINFRVSNITKQII
jgi:hypothetical protein